VASAAIVFLREKERERGARVSRPPTGTVTFLFTDIEGSTRLWERDRAAMSEALARHDRILRDAVEQHGGYVFKTVGDAFCCAFATALDGLEAALEAQHNLLSEQWEEGEPLKVRMALHTGAAEERDGDYFGPPVNRVARLLSAAHGGQVLLSLPTHEMVRDQLPAGGSLMDLGERRLKDLFRPERIFQLMASGLASSFPPLKTLDSLPNNLPLQPTPLVGREREVGEIAERVHGEEARLLTLTGPGGTGKTRLALQAAADLLEEFADGVFFVALATVTNPDLVPSAIAEPLGVRESAEQPLVESLEAYLREKELLLILDNFEQVLEAASFVGELLGACSRLKVLATSRTPLRLYGEREYPVPPLALPDPRVLPPLEVLTQYEAVRLFVERARAVKPDFSVTNESAPAVAEICARLDGLPLAIELAAARTRILPPQKMLERLSNRLMLLKGGARDLPARQQTLRGTIDWSYQLLNEEEKTLFGRLSVFYGGRTLEAIEEVCDPEGDLDALEGLESLLEKSLLRQEEELGGEPRFYMLETVHEYAREKLGESGEAEETSRLHAEYFLALAEEAEPRLRGPEDVEWLERLETEHDNMRAALSWARERGEVELRLHLAGALGWFWEAHGHYSEGRRWLEEALAQDDRASMAARVKALDRLSVLVQDLDREEALAQEGIKLSEQAGLGGSVVAMFLRSLGWIAMIRGDYAQMKVVFEESLRLSRDADDKWGIADALLGLGAALDSLDDHERSKELHEEGIDLARELGYASGLARLLFDLGYLLLLEGNYERGAALNEEAVAVFREHGYKGGFELALDNLGWAALLQGDYDRARTSYQESLTLCKELGDKWIASESLEGMACIAAAEGEAERAARLFGAAQALNEAGGYLHTPEEAAWREPYLATARSRLGEEPWEEALAEGRAMTLERAIAYALEEGAGVA
jgi:predicted ATPase/class 3 adenylate cyclase